jgi:hypothetical protein
MMKKIQFTLNSLFFGIFTLLPLGVYAASQRLTVPIPNVSNPGSEVTEVSTFGQYLTTTYKFAIILAAFFAIVFIVYSAVQYIFSRGDTSKISEAKDRITSAVYGLLLLIGATLILQTINPELRILTLNIEERGGINLGTDPTGSASSIANQLNATDRQAWDQKIDQLNVALIRDDINTRESAYLNGLLDYRYMISTADGLLAYRGRDYLNLLKNINKAPNDRFSGYYEGSGTARQLITGPLTIAVIASKSSASSPPIFTDAEISFFSEIESDVVNVISKVDPAILNVIIDYSVERRGRNSDAAKVYADSKGLVLGIDYQDPWEIIAKEIAKYTRYRSGGGN